MQIIDGKKLAQEIREKVKKEIQRSEMAPGLAAILVGDDPASRLYVKLKEKACQEVGIHFEKFLLDKKVKGKKLTDLIKTLNSRKDIHAILVQLPLPKHLNTDKIIAVISPEKDVDGFHPENTKLLLQNQSRVVPPTAKAVMKLIEKIKIPLRGKQAVLLARSQIFARPIKYLLEQKGIKVDIIRGEGNPPLTPPLCKGGVLRKADIIVTALGRPKFIKAEMLKPGVIIIDVSTVRIGNKVVGDVDFESIKDIAGHLTPVPGGVGPMTVACLLENTLILAK